VSLKTLLVVGVRGMWSEMKSTVVIACQMRLNHLCISTFLKTKSRKIYTMKH
jgi:hypothetical protein